MDRDMIQTPVTRDLRKKAEKKAEKDGFSSIQQVIRFFLAKYTAGELEVGIKEQFPPVQLSARAIKRYDRMTEDYEKGKNIFVAENVQDLMDQLNGVKDPVPFKISKAIPRKNIPKKGTRRSFQGSKGIVYR